LENTDIDEASKRASIQQPACAGFRRLDRVNMKITLFLKITIRNLEESVAFQSLLLLGNRVLLSLSTDSLDPSAVYRQQ
jgi:hypothetical protein